MKKGGWKVLISSFVIVYAVAFLGSIFTSSSVKSAWYESIKPSLTPPNWVFPVVWNILFFLISLALCFSWMNSDKKEKKRVSTAFGMNLIANFLWSVLYFGMHNPLVAFIDIIVVWLSIAWMILVCWKIDRKSAYMLIPYLLWVSFASVLNFLSISKV